MGVAFVAEHGLLAEDEREMVARSHYPALEGLDHPTLRDLAGWLRGRRARARDILHDRRRAKRGKGELRGAVSEPGTAHSLGDKKQVYARALKRVNARIEALGAAAKRAETQGKMRAALARVQGAEPHHPAGGDTAGAGMAPLARTPRRPGIIEGGRVGSVSQANKRGQAHRDARG